MFVPDTLSLSGLKSELLVTHSVTISPKVVTTFTRN